MAGSLYWVGSHFAQVDHRIISYSEEKNPSNDAVQMPAQHAYDGNGPFSPAANLFLNIEFFSARKGTLSWAGTLSWTWWSSQEKLLKPPNLKSWDVAQNSIKIPLTCKVKKCHSKQSRMRYAISIFIWYMSRVVLRLFLYGSSLFVRELRWKWWLFFCQWKLLCACIRLKDVVACVACGHSHDPRNDPSHLTCHYLPSNSFSFHKLDPKTTLQWNARILNLFEKRKKS